MPNTLSDKQLPRIRRRGLLAQALQVGALAGVGAPFILTSNRVNAIEPFRLGWIRPRTGKIAAAFSPAYIGGLIAVQEINASGGILGRQVVLVEEDDEASPEKEPAIVQKLQDAGIRYIIGPTGSSQALTSMVATTNAKIIQATYANAATAGDGYKFPYHYQASLSTESQGSATARYMVGQLKLRKIAILRENTAFGEQVTAATMRALLKYGMTPTAIEAYPVGASKFDTYISKLKASGAEGVITWIATGATAAVALNAMNNLNWRPQITGHNSMLDLAVLDLVPPEAMGNVVATHYKKLTWTDSEGPGARQLAYAQKIRAHAETPKGLEAIIAASPYYDFIHLLKSVIEKEKSFDIEIVKRALDKVTNYNGLLGDMTFTKERHTAFAPDDIAMATVLSGRDPRSQGIFRKRAST